MLRPAEGVKYAGFVDMSGGSSDDAALGIAHFDAARNRAVLDLVATQTGKPPFNPRDDDASVHEERYHPTRLSFQLSGLGGGAYKVPPGGLRSGSSTQAQGQDGSGLPPHRSVRETAQLDGYLGRVRHGYARQGCSAACRATRLS